MARRKSKEFSAESILRESMDELTQKVAKCEEEVEAAKKSYEEALEKKKQYEERMKMKEIMDAGAMFRDYIIAFNRLKVNPKSLMDAALEELKSGKGVLIGSHNFVSNEVKEEELVHGEPIQE